jgi:hypothetical protein
MDFFQSAGANPNASAEVLVRQHIKWNKGLRGQVTFTKAPPSPETRAKISAANKGRTQTKETRALMKVNAHKVRAKPIMTPLGLFPTRHAFAQAANMKPPSVNYWLKKCPEHYFYLD